MKVGLRIVADGEPSLSKFAVMECLKAEKRMLPFDFYGLN
jgi:hypothetical protein